MIEVSVFATPLPIPPPQGGRERLRAMPVAARIWVPGSVSAVVEG